VSSHIIISASVAVALKFGTINWVLRSGRSSKIERESSKTKGRLLRTDRVKISEIDKEESSGSGDCS
jgi:hypothetical protein